MITQMYDANRKLSKELKYFKILSIMISKKEIIFLILSSPFHSFS